MALPDKYKAVWVSHSSMGDFLKCPRLYYLRNIYKDPKTGRKMNIVTPALSLGVAVHEVLEGLAKFPSDVRLNRNLLDDFEKEWEKVTGEKGGFKSKEEEEDYKKRGIEMIKTVINNPRFLGNKIIKLPQEKMNPNFYLSEDDNLILNGLIDWIEYLPKTDSLHIIDFKTGKNEENEKSLQLPIYLLLCNALQKRKVSKASYWYLDSDKIVEKELPDKDEARRDVMEVAIKVKEAREKGVTGGGFNCPRGEEGCIFCRPFETILNGGGKNVGLGAFNQDLYIV